MIGHIFFKVQLAKQGLGSDSEAPEQESVA